MPRNKYPEETVRLILDVSYKLFLEKGYEHTTIQDIVDRLGGLTKGALYYHFKSKEELLLGVSHMIFANTQEDSVWENIANADLSAAKKLGMIIETMIADKNENMMRDIYPDLKQTPQFLVEMLQNCIKSQSHAIIADIIKQGVKDGSIKCDFPDEFGEVCMILMNMWLNPYVWQVSDEEMKKKLGFVSEMFEKYGIGKLEDIVSSDTYEKILNMNKK